MRRNVTGTGESRELNASALCRSHPLDVHSGRRWVPLDMPTLVLCFRLCLPRSCLLSDAACACLIPWRLQVSLPA